MAATPTLLANGTSTGNPATTASVSPTSTRLIEVDVIASAASPETIVQGDMAISGLSATWALVDFQLYGQRRAMWKFRCESDGTSGTLSLTYSGPGFAETFWAVKEWSGQVTGNNGADAVGTPVSGETGFNTTLTLGSVGTLSPGDAVSAFFGIESGNGAGVITGYTELVDQSGTNNNVRQMLVGWDDTDITASATWTGNSSAGGIANRIIAGSAAVTGTLAVTEEDDTLAASGTVTPPAFTGTVAVTEQDDTLAASGTVTPPAFTGTVAVTEQDDTLAASGTFTPSPVTGILTVTEQDDTLSATGTVVPPAFTGTLAVTEQDDTLAAAGTVTPPAFTGTLTVTEQDDILVASGTVVVAGVAGSLAVTEQDDTLAAAGTFTPGPVTGTLAVTEQDDTLVATGTVASGPITGTLAITEQNDTLAATGSFIPVGGGPIPDLTGTVTTDGLVGSVAVEGLSGSVMLRGLTGTVG